MVRLKALRKEKGLTQEKFAKIFHVGRSTVAMWETGVMPNGEVVQEVARFFGVSVDYLLGESFTRSTNAPGAIRIPVLGSIPAGVPLEAIQDIEDYEEIDVSMLNGGKEYFALKISGDSMAPNYLDGDVVLLRVAEECRSGQDCAVMVNDEEGVFKRVKLMENGMMLHPLNPDFEPRFFTEKADVILVFQQERIRQTLYLKEINPHICVATNVQSCTINVQSCTIMYNQAPPKQSFRTSTKGFSSNSAALDMVISSSATARRVNCSSKWLSSGSMPDFSSFLRPCAVIHF